MINGQPHAIEIETILRDVFNCDRMGFGGIVNSDFIRKNPFAAMFSAAGYLYANSNVEKKEEIEEFIKNNQLYTNMSINDILSFETSQKEENGKIIEIEFENGEEAIKSIKDNFRKICSEK